MGKGVGSNGDVKNVDFTEYNDGIYVCYRHYQTKNVPVSYPFGYGMSYTTFKYGKPAKELRGFAKTKSLKPGESETVTILIPYENLASFNATDSQWQVEAGVSFLLVVICTSCPKKTRKFTSFLLSNL